MASQTPSEGSISPGRYIRMMMSMAGRMRSSNSIGQHVARAPRGVGTTGIGSKRFSRSRRLVVQEPAGVSHGDGAGQIVGREHDEIAVAVCSCETRGFRQNVANDLIASVGPAAFGGNDRRVHAQHRAAGGRAAAEKKDTRQRYDRVAHDASSPRRRHLTASSRSFRTVPRACWTGAWPADKTAFQGAIHGREQRTEPANSPPGIARRALPGCCPSCLSRPPN